MNRTKNITLLLYGLFLFVLLSGCAFRTADTEAPVVEIGSIREGAQEDPRVVMTEAELQSHLMSFADRFASLLQQSFEDFDELSPPPEQRRIIQRNAVNSVASVFTIAAESDPDVALLDMVVMVTLAHSIYEEHWLLKLGPSVASMERGFRKAEDDVWKIAAKLLNPDQQAELLTMIQEWRRQNPEELAFAYVRFSDFAAKRRKATLSKSRDPKGLFQSVEVATKQVQEIKLLAERGMFLATRMPLLTGFYMDTSLSQVLTNPQVKGILSDLHRVSSVSERMAEVAELLPTMIDRERQAIIEQTFAKLTAEREAAINQAMDRLAEERTNTIEEFLAEETRLRGFLTDLKETLMEGNNLVVSTNSLAERLNLGATPGSFESFDINDYRETLRNPQ